MTSTTRSKKLVAAAARRWVAYMARRNGGRLPRTVAGWLRLCRMEGVCAGPMTACPASFTARLWHDPEHDLWVIGYNPAASDLEICRYLCHELSEYLAIFGEDSLFDGLPFVRPEPGNCARVYFYDGGDTPEVMHHQIALKVEFLIFG